MKGNEPSFLPGFQVHPIQAQLAWEDRENWGSGLLTSIEGSDLIVGLPGGSTRRLWSQSASSISGALPSPVLINDRYHVLALKAAPANVTPIVGKVAAGRVFVWAEESPVRFISIASSEPAAVDEG